jgi:hypothetical protein
MARKRQGIPELSFSWKRAFGVSSAKGKLSRRLGVPLTKSGRQRKVGSAVGCCIPIGFVLVGFGGLGFASIKFALALLV